MGGSESLEFKLIWTALDKAQADVDIGTVVKLLAENPYGKSLFPVLYGNSAAGRMELVPGCGPFGSVAAAELLSLNSIQSAAFQL